MKKQTSPDAPKNDIIKESAVVFNLQLLVTVLLKTRQNPPHKNNVSPKIKANSKRSPNKREVKYIAVGPSAPPIIPILPF